MMRILVIGKRNSVGAWYEYTYNAFKKNGYQVDGFAINGNSFLEHLQYKYLKKNREGYDRFLQSIFAKHIQNKKYDLCISLSSYWMPYYLFETLRDQNPACVLVGWVGDKFEAQSGRYAALFDTIYYTDSQFLLDHSSLGFKDNHKFLPHAVDHTIFTGKCTHKKSQVLFIANKTPYREEIVDSIRQSIKIIGRGWRQYKKSSRHQISPRRIHFTKLSKMYDQYFCILNVKNETHVFNGLNQRSFEPYGCGTPVVHDYVADLDKCFDLDKEILVYKCKEELNHIIDRISSEPTYARKIGAAGQKRVLSNHTYKNRITTILKNLD